MQTTSGSRVRTQQAIVDAAIRVLATSPTASLGEIAEAAQVGRTTLHRYFPDRAALIKELSTRAVSAITDATHQARLERDTGREAVVRLLQSYFEIGDLLKVLLLTPGVYEEEEWAQHGDVDQELIDVVLRGHRDGTIDPELSPEWVQNLIWALLYTSIDLVNRNQGPAFAVLSQAVTSLRRAVTPD
ncbi:TetR/AcrR family transcriptional regulator [Hoyosella sp. YIM 151337]|uniref:TetR/AcrR family transcriptional regulator n=1 Tax=Hoyosella sp. YIM 151337 TaxID=2992742 RepID=UPI002236403F|nr:TetR/AcrR family transcriptional regulator [Hoyosella sp. YIM 151337]MCW4351850.1 TetR/AcrR family transcriptional regulator [Hoyosella sp. YIM 151337]